MALRFKVTLVDWSVLGSYGHAILPP